MSQTQTAERTVLQDTTQAPTQELAARAPQQMTSVSPTPGDMLRYAIEQKADLGYLRELMALQKEWDANEARKEYVAAMAAFKADPPTITKDKLVSFKTKDGDVTEYMHATIGNVVEKICGALGRHGLSHRWDTKQGNAGQVEVTCTITHERGHSESTSLRAMEDNSGKKNAIQMLASTVTYLQRYTLLALTGLATKDGDDDGRGDAPIHTSDLLEEAELDPKRAKLVANLRAKGDEGMAALQLAWSELTKEQRQSVGLVEWNAIKERAEVAP